MNILSADFFLKIHQFVEDYQADGFGEITLQEAIDENKDAILKEIGSFWIPVEERLPESKDNDIENSDFSYTCFVIVDNGDGVFDLAIDWYVFSDQNWYYNYENVKYWHKCPPLPKVCTQQQNS